MSAPSGETAHLLSVFERLEDEDVKIAFFELLHRLYTETGLTFRFLSRGKFSAIHLLFDPEGTSYGDAEFAFKGAKDHMRWWFRPPCCERGLLRPEEIRERLSSAIEREDGHWITDVRNCRDVEAVIGCVKLAGLRYSKT